MKKLKQPEIFYTEQIGINAKFFGKKPAVVCGEERQSWEDFHRRTNMVANALLGLGLKKGDKVALLMQNSVAMFELIWGTIKAGGVTVPINVMLAQDSLGIMINNSEAKWVFADPVTAPQIEPIKAQLTNVQAEGFYAIGGLGGMWKPAEALVDGGSVKDPKVKLKMTDSMNIIYSSGTTGVPKGIEHSHFARHMYSFGVGPVHEIDRWTVSLCATPLYTNGTWINMLPTVFSGGTTVLLKKFSGENFFQTVEREKCTHVFMVPTQFIVLLESPALHQYDHSSLRMLVSGGQALPTKTADGIRQHLKSAGLWEMYGMTEGYITLCTPEDMAHGKVGSVGLPVFGGDICIINEKGKQLARGKTGEICGWSPGLMKGYYRDEKRTEDIIWKGPNGRTYLRSGDIGRMDEDGYLYISGRVKDMIKSGGINVFAADIEEVFMRHPDVMEATAIGIPHDKWGETPLLFAIMRESAKASEAELAEWGNARLGKFQRVARVEYRQEFPRVTHDKVNKRALRDPYWEGREKQI